MVDNGERCCLKPLAFMLELNNDPFQYVYTQPIGFSNRDILLIAKRADGFCLPDDGA